MTVSASVCEGCEWEGWSCSSVCCPIHAPGCRHSASHSEGFKPFTIATLITIGAYATTFHANRIDSIAMLHYTSAQQRVHVRHARPTCKTSLEALSSFMKRVRVSFFMASSLRKRAVFAVSLRLCTKMSIWCLPAASKHCAYVGVCVDRCSGGLQTGRSCKLKPIRHEKKKQT